MSFNNVKATVEALKKSLEDKDAGFLKFDKDYQHRLITGNLSPEEKELNDRLCNMTHQELMDYVYGERGV